MTDLSAPTSDPHELPVPARLGVTGRYEGDELVLDVAPRPETEHHGVIRASVLSFLIDAVAGIPIDEDPDFWSLTTDMTVRMQAIPAPARISASNRILRRKGRTSSCMVELTTDTGALIGAGAIGFTRVPRKPTDGPKHSLTPEAVIELFGRLPTVTRPLREEVGVEVIDAAAGIVQVELSPKILNTAGTLQGAMVALVAEAAAEDLVEARFGRPAVVTDLDLRYVARSGAGPIRTKARLIGSSADSTIEIEMVDTSTDSLTTLVYARATPVDPVSP